MGSALTPEQIATLLRGQQINDAEGGLPKQEAPQPQEAQLPAPEQAQPMPVQAQQPPAQLPIMEQQLAQARQQAQPAGFGEKLAKGLLSLPGVRQTAGAVAAPFFPDREAAQEKALNLSTQIEKIKRLYEGEQGELEGGEALMQVQHPDVFGKLQGLKSPEARRKFIKAYVDMNKLIAESQESAGKGAEAFARTADIPLDTAETKRHNLATEAIQRDNAKKDDTDKQYLKDETEIRNAMQRGLAAARTSPYVTRLMTAKVGAEDVHNLLIGSTQGGDGKIILNRPAVGEVMASLQRTLSMGGQSSVEMMKEITPRSAHGKLADMIEWATGHPQEMLTDAQFQNLLAVSDRQNIFLGSKLAEFKNSIKGTLTTIFDRDRARGNGVSTLETMWEKGMNDATREVAGGTALAPIDEQLAEMAKTIKALEEKDRN